MTTLTTLPVSRITYILRTHKPSAPINRANKHTQNSSVTTTLTALPTCLQCPPHHLPAESRRSKSAPHPSRTNTNYTQTSSVTTTLNTLPARPTMSPASLTCCIKQNPNAPHPSRTQTHANLVRHDHSHRLPACPPMSPASLTRCITHNPRCAHQSRKQTHANLVSHSRHFDRLPKNVSRNTYPLHHAQPKSAPIRRAHKHTQTSSVTTTLTTMPACPPVSQPHHLHAASRTTQGAPINRANKHTQNSSVTTTLTTLPACPTMSPATLTCCITHNPRVHPPVAHTNTRKLRQSQPLSPLCPLVHQYLPRHLPAASRTTQECTPSVAHTNTRKPRQSQPLSPLCPLVHQICRITYELHTHNPRVHPIRRAQKRKPRQ